MSDESKSLVKWKVALAVGVGTAAVVGGALLAYYALRSQRSEPVVDNTGSASPQDTPTPTSPPQTKITTQSTLERAQAIKQQGNDFYKQQKYEEAIKCYKEAISVCPQSKSADLAIFHQNLAAVYDVMAQKATDPDQKASCFHEALENCTRAFEHNPRYIKAMTRRLKIYETLDRKKEAILDVTRVLILDESQGRTLSQAVAKLLKEFGQEEAKKNFPKLEPLAPSKFLVRTYFESFTWTDDLSEERLKELWSTRSKPKVIEVTEAEPVREDGEDVVILVQPETQEVTEEDGFNEEPFVKAAAAFRENKFHGILELLTEAITNGNSVFVPHAQLLRGALNTLWRQSQKGLKDLQDVVNTQGLSKEMYANALVQRASVFALQGDMEKCRTCFTKALAIDPNCADVFIYRARLMLESEEQQAGIGTVVQDLEKGLSLAPSSPQVAYLLASAYHRLASMQQSLQLLETAKTKFSEAVEKFPNFGDGLLLYSMFLQDSNQIKKAEEFLQKVVKLEPDNPMGHFTLGLTTLMVSQDVDKALQLIETAITKDNSCVQAYNTLATIEMQRNNTEKAMEMYGNAIAYSRSEAEMAQAYVSREVVTAQNQACREYGVTQLELASRAYGAPSSGMY